MDNTESFSKRNVQNTDSEHLLAIFSEAAVGLCEISTDGRFLLVNKAFCKIVGRSSADLLGRCVFDFTHPDDVPASAAAVARLIETGDAALIDKRYVRPDGSVVWVSNGVTRLGAGSRQSPFTVLAATVDVNSRKHAQESIAADLASMTRLHQLSTQLTGTRQLSALLQQVLDAVIELHQADFGHIQLYDGEEGALTIAAQRGFDAAYLAQVACVDEDSPFACGWVLKLQRPVIVEDVASDARYAGLREIAARAGYRAVQSTPLLDRTGELIGILTIHFRDPHRVSERALRMTDLYARQAADTIAAKLAEKALRERTRQLRFALDAARMGTWVWDVVSDRIKLDARALHILGTQPEMDHSFAAVLERHVHADDAPRVRDAVRRVLETGEQDRFELEYRWLRPDGRQIWLSHSGQAHFEHRDEQRRAVRVNGTLLDISERKRVEERQALLMQEVNHRSKNILATINAMISLSARSHGSVAEFAAALHGRIQSMSKIQKLVSDARWDGAGLRQLITAELAPYLDSRPDAAILDGEDIVLKPVAAMGLTMIIHELTTNAVKYGALSTPYGSVHLFWRRAPDGALALKWIEMDGPPVAAPKTAGFGSLLIPRCLDGELGGHAEIRYEPEGLVCDMHIPAEHLSTPPHAAQQEGQEIDDDPSRRNSAPPNDSARDLPAD